MAQPHRAIGLVRAAAWCVAAGVAGLAAQQQAPPVFRSGVDLVSVEVVVVNSAGEPVRNLTAEDFTVVAGRTPRRVVAADFVNASPPDRTALAAAVPSASSNQSIVAARTLIVLADTEQIPTGGGRAAMTAIGEFLDRLGPNDRVGVMTLAETPLVGVTTDHAKARAAVSKLVGSAIRLRDREMTFGEAAGIAVRDRSSLMAYWYRVADQGFASSNRTCEPVRGFDTMLEVPLVCVQAAEVVLERARYHSRRVLRRVMTIADAMASLPSPKAVLFVSGGLFNDGGTRTDMAEVAAVAERSRVSVHTLLIEAEGGAGGGNTAETRRLDSQIGFAGLVDLAASTRGSAQRLPGEATGALARINGELSGYYLVSFERDPGDRAGERADLSVRTKRPGLTVIANKGVTPARVTSAAARTALDLKASVGELLKSSQAVGQVPIDVAAFALPVSESGADARVALTVEIGRDPSAVSAFGFVLADDRGRIIADGYDAPAKVQAAGAGRSGVIPQVTVSPGRFTARVGVIDAQGQRGSLQHTFEIPSWPAGPIRVSDLIIGDTTAGDFRPSARVAPGPSPIAIRLVLRDATSRFEGVQVRMAITRAADDSLVETLEVPLQTTPDPLRRFADASLAGARYPQGEYVVSATVTAQGAEVGRRRRLFSK